MSRITTHVLDTGTGTPAAGVALALSRELPDGHWAELASATTDKDGRVAGLPILAEPGTYRIRFHVGAYFAAAGTPHFHPYVDVVFVVENPDEHHHVPLLASPFGYSTYRGS